MLRKQLTGGHSFLAHVRWLSVLALLVGLMASAAFAPGVSAAAASPSVTPEVGGPHTRFTFVADGFMGDADTEDEYNDAEMVSFWINTPDGQTMGAVRDGVHKDDPNPTAVRANSAGHVEYSWRAMEGLTTGRYTMVAYGNYSAHTVVIPFRIEGNSRGEVINAPATVSPAVGSAGSTFTFVISGFKVDDDNDEFSNNAEKVVFWVNMPNGVTEEAYCPGADEDDENATLTQANPGGQVVWIWQAPSNAVSGKYTLVAHGLESEHEQVISFEIH
jgi:hypothetical protein